MTELMKIYEKMCMQNKQIKEKFTIYKQIKQKFMLA